MESLDKDKVTATALPSLDDDITSNAISSAARVLGRTTRIVVENMKTIPKASEKIKEIFTREKSVAAGPEEMAQELADEGQILQREIEARQKAEAQIQALEMRLMEEQKAREAAEKRAAEAEAATEQQEKRKKRRNRKIIEQDDS